MKALIIGFLVLTGIYIYLRPPGTHDIANEMKIDIEKGTIVHNETIYDASWNPRTTYSGNLRLIERVYYKQFPILTQQAMLTTGEWSNPDIVSVESNTQGRFKIKSKKKPEGTLKILLLIPANSKVTEKITKLKIEQPVKFMGREESDGAIKTSKGTQARFGGNNYIVFLVEDVSQ